jgi:3-dehydroquinate dehydratase-1
MQDCGADITKAAVMPQNEQDVLEVLKATLAMKQQYADRPFITMSMGRLGAITRLAGGLTGSALTFATAGRASAPGQLEAQALSALLPNLS